MNQIAKKEAEIFVRQTTTIFYMITATVQKQKLAKIKTQHNQSPNLAIDGA